MTETLSGDVVGPETALSVQQTAPAQGDTMGVAPADKPETPETRKKLVQKILTTIKEDKSHYDKAFKRMTRDMHLAYFGAPPGYPEEKYKVNVTNRHIRQKTATLYAKNPRAAAKRKETLDFAVWDESPQSLEIALQTLTMASQMSMGGVDPATGAPMEGATALPPGFEQAKALIEDYQTGMQRRQALDRYGKTLEILFSRAMAEQSPLDFKTSLKRVIRRACTTGVGYVVLAYQRVTGESVVTTARLTDARDRLNHLRSLAEDVASGEITENDPEILQLQQSIKELEKEPETVLREGVVYDFPQSTKVIPDKLCKHLVGFVGARHVTLEYDYTVGQVKDLYKTDLSKGRFTPYTVKRLGENDGEENAADVVDSAPSGTSDAIRMAANGKCDDNMARVWRHYDKETGLVYTVLDGYDDFLQEPGTPEVFVTDFWPIYALTFNEVEHESMVFPPSDVSLMEDMQIEYNNSRQGKREHRTAARPRWGYAKGLLSDEDQDTLRDAEAFEAVALNFDPQYKLKDLLQAIPVPGVDPNLYDVNEVWRDFQVSVGTQEAMLGGIAKATATESSISASSSASADGASIDDLDSFLSMIARATGQVLQREMAPEYVMKAVGPGAVWPELSLSDIANEVYLEVAAGSTGKPNQAVEINNWKQLMPFLLQMPSVSPVWLAQETVRRLDDRVDISKALSQGVPSIVAQNAMQQPGTGNAATDPKNQGAQGAQNAPQAPQPAAQGSSAAFGSNQV